MNKKLYIFNLSGLLYDKYNLISSLNLINIFKNKNIILPYSLVFKYSNYSINSQIKYILLNKTVNYNWLQLYNKKPKINIDAKLIENKFNENMINYIDDYFNMNIETKNIINILKQQNINVAINSNLNFKNTKYILDLFKNDNVLFDNYVTTDCINSNIDNPFMIYKNMYDLNITDINNITLISSSNEGILSGKKANCNTIGICNTSSSMNIYTEKDYDKYETLFNTHQNDFSNFKNYNRILSEYNNKLKNTNKDLQKYNPDKIYNSIEYIFSKQ